MSYNPYVFTKSYNDRLIEFYDILDRNLKARDIRCVWNNHIELEIEPLGWQAIWKVSRYVCEDLKIQFPCTVIVIVEHVNFEEHTCQVSITEVEDENIQLPEKMSDVSLIELYPTTEQDDSSALSLFTTANLIDSLRFFYHNLWMPWDLDFDEDIPWVESHLESRLKLYYGMMDCTVPVEVTYTVQRLMSESRAVQRQVEELQEQLLERESETLPSQTLLTLTELHNQLSSLRNEYKIYEKPDLLTALVERNQQKENTQQNVSEFVFLVLSVTSPEGLFNLASLTKHLQPENKPLRLVPSLQEAIAKAVAGATVWLTQGQHHVRGLGALERGGSLSGLEPGVVVMEDNNGCSTIDLHKGSVALSSLTISMISSGNIIKVRPNVECRLCEVKLQGSTVTDGIDVFSGARLTANNCNLASCGTAVVCYPNSTVHLRNCTFTNNNIAIEIRGSCSFSMENCSILGSKLCAVQLLMSKPRTATSLTIAHINSIPQMKEVCNELQNNATDLRYVPPLMSAEVYQNGCTNLEIKKSN